MLQESYAFLFLKLFNFHALFYYNNLIFLFTTTLNYLIFNYLSSPSTCNPLGVLLYVIDAYASHIGSLHIGFFFHSNNIMIVYYYVVSTFEFAYFHLESNIFTNKNTICFYYLLATFIIYPIHC